MEPTAHKLFDLEIELLSCDWILEKVRNNDFYAQNLYAALCNNEFVKNEVLPILKEDIWSCSWRYAGQLLVDMKGHGDYLDYYCSGMMWDSENIPERYAPEGVITDEIRADLLKLGWVVFYNDK